MDGDISISDFYHHVSLLGWGPPEGDMLYYRDEYWTQYPWVRAGVVLLRQEPDLVSVVQIVDSRASEIWSGIIRTEADLQRMAALVAQKIKPAKPDSPVYNIADYFPDKIDAIAGQSALGLVVKLQGKICGGFYEVPPFHRRPDSVLLPPEIAVNDFVAFDSTMGNGFGVQLGYCGGPELFARGLRAAKTIGAVGHVEVMEEAKRIMERHGLVFPEPLPEFWWHPNEGLGWALHDLIRADTNDLDKRYFELNPHYRKTKDVYLTLLEYVHSRRVELDCRRTPPLPAQPPPLPS